MMKIIYSQLYRFKNFKEVIKDEKHVAMTCTDKNKQTIKAWHDLVLV